MDTIGPWELLIIVVVLVALFGASRLPKMARGLGEGIREFKKGIAEASSPRADSQTSGPAGEQPGRTAQQPSQPAGQPDRLEVPGPGMQAQETGESGDPARKEIT